MTKLYTVEVKGGENIFAALGFPADEAEALWAESHRRDREEDALKLSLADAISTWVEESSLTKIQAASQLCVARKAIDQVLRKQLNDLSINDLFQMVFRTGKSVTVSMR